MSWFDIGGALLGGLFGSDSSDDAAAAQQAATEASIAENRRQFDLTRGDFAPARNIGTNALRRIAALYGLDDGIAPSGGGTTGAGGLSENQIRQLLAPRFTTPATPAGYEPVGRNDTRYVPPRPETIDEAGLAAAMRQFGAVQPGQAATAPRKYNDGLDDPIQMDPGYQFGMQQGQQALDRKIAASGGRVSGQALKAAQRFGTDYATTGYNAAYQRRQDRLNRLAELAGIGQTATGASAAAGEAAAGRNSQLLSSQGDAAGAARLAQGNIWANTTNQIASAAKRWNTPTAGFTPGVGSLGAGGSPDGYW